MDVHAIPGKSQASLFPRSTYTPIPLLPPLRTYTHLPAARCCCCRRRPRRPRHPSVPALTVRLPTLHCARSTALHYEYALSLFFPRPASGPALFPSSIRIHSVTCVECLLACVHSGPAWLLPEVTETRRPLLHTQYHAPVFIPCSPSTSAARLSHPIPSHPSSHSAFLPASTPTDRQTNKPFASLSTASALYDGSNRGFTVGTRVSEASTTLTRTTDRPTHECRRSADPNKAFAIDSTRAANRQNRNTISHVGDNRSTTRPSGGDYDFRHP